MKSTRCQITTSLSWENVTHLTLSGTSLYKSDVEMITCQQNLVGILEIFTVDIFVQISQKLIHKNPFDNDIIGSLLLPIGYQAIT